MFLNLTQITWITQIFRALNGLIMNYELNIMNYVFFLYLCINK